MGNKKLGFDLEIKFYLVLKLSNKGKKFKF